MKEFLLKKYLFKFCTVFVINNINSKLCEYNKDKNNLKDSNNNSNNSSNNNKDVKKEEEDDDDELKNKKKELKENLKHINEMYDQLNWLGKSAANINISEDEINKSNIYNIGTLELKIENTKEHVEKLLKVNKEGYQSIFIISGKNRDINFYVVKKEDKYIYLLHEYNEFAKSTSTLDDELNEEKVKNIEFQICNKEDKLTFDEIVNNIDEHKDEKLLIDAFQYDNLLTLKCTDKDSNEINYKCDISKNRDFIIDENHYWFNYKDGKKGDYCFDNKTKSFGFVDKNDGNKINFAIDDQTDYEDKFKEGK